MPGGTIQELGFDSMIPKSFVQDLLSRVDIVDVIESHIPLKRAGSNLTACCPFHNEKSPSFTVSPTKQFYHCFGCGAHGSAISFLMEYSGLNFVEAVKDLAQRAGMQVPEVRAPRAEAAGGGGTESSEALLDLLHRAAAYYKAELKKSERAIAYLKGRGLTGEIAARFGLGYAPHLPSKQRVACSSHAGPTNLFYALEGLLQPLLDILPPTVTPIWECHVTAWVAVREICRLTEFTFRAILFVSS